MPKRPVNHHKAYHAHVYFDEQTFSFAQQLCETAGKQFELKVGRFHRQPIGPHPMWSCQITFGKKHFEQLIPWLDSHREGLTILVHGLTGDDLKDHTDYAYWLGESVPLNLAIFESAK